SDLQCCNSTENLTAFTSFGSDFKCKLANLRSKRFSILLNFGSLVRSLAYVFIYKSLVSFSSYKSITIRKEVVVTISSPNFYDIVLVAKSCYVLFQNHFHDRISLIRLNFYFKESPTYGSNAR